MKRLFAVVVLLASPIARADDPMPGWVCIARTPVLQRAFTGYGNSEAAARGASLEKCQEHALFGCYVAACYERTRGAEADGDDQRAQGDNL